MRQISIDAITDAERHSDESADNRSGDAQQHGDNNAARVITGHQHLGDGPSHKSHNNHSPCN